METQGQVEETQGQVGGTPRYTKIPPHTEGYPQKQVTSQNINNNREREQQTGFKLLPQHHAQPR